MIPQQPDYSYLYHSPKAKVRLGDYYEDCSYHPCVAIKVDYVNDEVIGLSLLDKNHVSNCSFRHCGIIRLRRSFIDEYLKILPFQRWFVTNAEELKEKDPTYWDMFKDQLPRAQEQVKHADKLREWSK